MTILLRAYRGCTQLIIYNDPSPFQQYLGNTIKIIVQNVVVCGMFGKKKKIIRRRL
ncbi:MAG TPA: hypothetical protein VIP70_07875 [Nitrososphaeraceae archaeon]